MAFFEHERNRYYYYDEGSGTPILLLHGLGNSGRAWTGQVTALLDLGHRVIVPDLLGHGASSDAPLGITPRIQARELLALLDYLGLESSLVLGLSLGGMIALQLACEHPNAVEKLIVAGTFVRMNSAHHKRLLSTWSDTLGQHDACLKRFEDTWLDLVGESFAASAQGRSEYQAWRAQAATQRPDSQRHWCEGLQDYELSDELQHITAPTLVMTCVGDRISPQYEAHDIANRISHARIASIAGDGHVFNVSNAIAFNEAVSVFLQEQHHG